MSAPSFFPGNIFCCVSILVLRHLKGDPNLYPQLPPLQSYNELNGCDVHFIYEPRQEVGGPLGVQECDTCGKEMELVDTVAEYLNMRLVGSIPSFWVGAPQKREGHVC